MYHDPWTFDPLGKPPEYPKGFEKWYLVVVGALILIGYFAIGGN